jgi:hypothetical protein
MKKFHKMELKSPSIPLFPPGQRPKGETPIPIPFVKGGGEGLFLFQKAKFIRKLKSNQPFDVPRSKAQGLAPSKY